MVAAAVGVAGCGGSGGSSSGARPSIGGSPSASASPAATDAVTTEPPATGGRPLSKVWAKKLTAEQDQVGKCQQPSAAECGTAIDNTVTFVSSLLDAMNADTNGVAYTKSLKDATSIADGASSYVSLGCEGDPSADEDGSPCYKAALDVLVGVPILQQDMATDELNSGVG